MVRAFWNSDRLGDLLQKGWEPLSVVVDEGEHVVYLRKSHVVVVDVEVRNPD